MKIIETLQTIQTRLNAPKNQFNNFGGYSYRNCEDILEALKPILAEYKASVVISDEVVQRGDRFYVKATATLYCGDEKISSSAEAREPVSKKGMDEAQITGATSSYARKYALNGLFAIDDNKDPDSSPNSGKNDKLTQENNKPIHKNNSEIKCSKCGNVIKGAVKNNKKLTASEVAKQCGGMCVSCYKQTVAKGSE